MYVDVCMYVCVYTCGLAGDGNECIHRVERRGGLRELERLVDGYWGSRVCRMDVLQSEAE